MRVPRSCGGIVVGRGRCRILYPYIATVSVVLWHLAINVPLLLVECGERESRREPTGQRGQLGVAHGEAARPDLLGGPNQVVSASRSPVSVPSPTQATYPSGRISTARGGRDLAQDRKLPHAIVAGVD